MGEEVRVVGIIHINRGCDFPGQVLGVVVGGEEEPEKPPEKLEGEGGRLRIRRRTGDHLRIRRRTTGKEGSRDERRTTGKEGRRDERRARDHPRWSCSGKSATRARKHRPAVRTFVLPRLLGRLLGQSWLR